MLYQNRYGCPAMVVAVKAVKLKTYFSNDNHGTGMGPTMELEWDHNGTGMGPGVRGLLPYQ